MVFRHEVKHQISLIDSTVLKDRMKFITSVDQNTLDGKYFVRSIYFDNITDKVLREKIDGINIREKFRIRYYNNDTSFIRLEKKSKINGLCNKQVTILTEEQVRQILENNISWMVKSEDKIIQELYGKIRNQNLKPKTIVDYIREPFIYKPGNVRITIDSNIRTGLTSTDFLNPNCVTVPVSNSPIILEVKWDEYLPSIISDIIQIGSCRSQAFSKYAAARVYD